MKSAFVEQEETEKTELKDVLPSLLSLFPPVDPGPWRLALRCLADVYLWTTILAILAWAHRLLNRPWRWLPWANEQVYPWYVLHQTLIIVAITWLAPLQLGPVIEPTLLVLFTVGGCWALTALIRRSTWLRPLFGLKRPKPPRRPSPGTRGRPAAHNA